VSKSDKDGPIPGGWGFGWLLFIVVSIATAIQEAW
jgi:hypothetical protein